MYYISLLIQFSLFFILNFKLFHYDTKKTKFILILAAFNSVSIFLVTLIGPSAGIIVIIFLSIINYYFSEKILASVLLPMLLLLLSIIYNYVLILIVSTFWGYDMSISPRPFDQILQNSVPIVLAFFTIKILSRVVQRYRVGFKLSNKIIFTIIGMFSITIILFYFNIVSTETSSEVHSFVKINLIFFGIYLLFTLLLVLILIKSVINKITSESKSKEHEQLMEYTEKLELLYSDMRKFRHDYVNILSSMSEYIKDENMEALRKYYEEKIMDVSKVMDSNNLKLSSLKNIKVKEVKGILSSKLIKAQEKGINVSFENTEEIDMINMDTLILCRSIGIIIDNSIEELDLLGKGKMQVAFIKKENSLIFVVVNTCRDIEEKLFQLFKENFSTKGENRGLGLSNLKEMISACDNVNLDTRIENNLFIQEIEIFNS